MLSPDQILILDAEGYREAVERMANLVVDVASQWRSNARDPKLTSRARERAENVAQVLTTLSDMVTDIRTQSEPDLALVNDPQAPATPHLDALDALQAASLRLNDAGDTHSLSAIECWRASAKAEIDYTITNAESLRAEIGVWASFLRIRANG
jgi:hypothetical protein